MIRLGKCAESKHNTNAGGNEREKAKQWKKKKKAKCFAIRLFLLGHGNSFITSR